jgi:hypothetical protein
MKKSEAALRANKKWKATNPDKVSEYNSKYYQKNKRTAMLNKRFSRFIKTFMALPDDLFL